MKTRDPGKSWQWSRRIALTAGLLAASSAHAAICYVKWDAPGGGGASWAAAYTDLQSALVNPACQDIYVARGTYKPTSTTDRTSSFNVRPGVYLYGGFAGTEVSVNARFLAANPTILSGDIGVAGDASDNSYHVVVMDGTTINGTIYPGSTLLSDFTIRGGNANGGGANEGSGGGLYCNGQGATHECSPELNHLIFEDNSAQAGGAISADGHGGGKSSPWLHDSIVRHNDAPGGAGGGMYNGGSGAGSVSSPLIEQVTFSGNSANVGGAMYNYGLAGTANPTIRNSTFSANTAQSDGGAILDNGASGGHASPLIRYTTFNDNRAVTGHGGAIYNIAPSADAAPNLSGVVLWGDHAMGSPVENYTSFSATVSSLDYSITPECPGGAVGCINADPLLGALQDNDGFVPTLKPGIGSPAIDNGNAANCPAFDARGVARPQGAKCDIGAVELRAAERQRCYVNKNNPSPGGGSSWATSYQSIYSALIDSSCGQVWVAAGTYLTNNLFGASAFGIPPGKALYGGFAGTEVTLGQRIPASNETILDGQGLYHVVSIDATGSAANVGGSTVLDGFTIKNGNANGSDTINKIGGGLICNGNSGYTCSPTLSNLVFTANNAVAGGALALNGSGGGVSSPYVQSVTFSANHATNTGGAVFNTGVNGTCTPTFSDVLFVNNSSDAYGGAVSNAGNGGVTKVTFIDSVLEGNTAVGFGGAIQNQASDETFVDVVLRNNSTQGYAGAILNDDALGAIHSEYSLVTFAGNTSNSESGALYNYFAAHATSTAVLDRVSFLDNEATASFGGAIVQLGGTLVVSASLFARNRANCCFGGAVALRSGTNATIDGSTFVANSSYYGGGVALAGANAVVTNSTFIRNTGSSGGAISAIAGYMGSPAAGLQLKNVTLYDNSATVTGGAVGIDPDNSAGSSSATISDSLIWNNAAPNSPAVKVGTNGSASIDHAIVQGGCPAGAACGTVTSSDPLLGAFQFYGGDTPTLMPAANSPALNIGASCTAFDQRGVARPQGAACDLGAVERRAVEDYLFNDGFDY